MIELIVGIFTGIAATLIYRQTQSGKKAFFKNQLKQAEQSIWDTEFNKFSAMLELEKVKQLHTQGEDQLSQTKDNKQKVQLESQLKALKTQMVDLEEIINGAPPSEKYEHGMRGLQEKLEATVQKREKIKSFIKHNC